jgi:hypothetical protein
MMMTPRGVVIYITLVERIVVCGSIGRAKASAPTNKQNGTDQNENCPDCDQCGHCKQANDHKDDAKRKANNPINGPHIFPSGPHGCDTPYLACFKSGSSRLPK